MARLVVRGAVMGAALLDYVQLPRHELERHRSSGATVPQPHRWALLASMGDIGSQFAAWPR